MAGPLPHPLLNSTAIKKIFFCGIPSTEDIYLVVKKAFYRVIFVNHLHSMEGEKEEIMDK